MVEAPRDQALPQRRTGGEPTLRSRARRRRRRSREIPITVNLAPMIDVTFLLLIFFLVTTTFERAEGILSSDLPRDSGVPAVALPISPIIVRVTQTGPDHEDYSIRIDRLTNESVELVKLTDVLKQIHGQPGFDEETPVVIVAGNRVRWDHVVGCWNAALRAGCKRIAFAEPQNP